MSAGQCKTDPVSGIAGDIYNSWTGDGDNGLASAALVSGGPVRKLLGAQVAAIATAIDAHSGGGAHTNGTTVSWSAGSGAGQFQFGAAFFQANTGSALGCDEGGVLTFNSGGSTSSGLAFSVQFATAWPTNPPAISIAPGNDNAAIAMFSNRWYVTSTTSGFSLYFPATAPTGGSITYNFHWTAKVGT
jgi:hypothetical protein